MIRSLTTTALVGACFAAATSQAAEVTFSGTVDAGTLIGFDSLENAPVYNHNLEANLTADIKLSDAVSAQLYGAALAGAVPTDPGPNGGRWPTFNFDGATITWKVGEDKTLMFGDIVYGRGTTGYYAYKRYTTGSRTQAVQGVSFSTAGFTAYVGNPDIQQDVTAWGVDYLAPLSEELSLDVFGDITTGLSQNLPWTAGLQAKRTSEVVFAAITGTVFGADPAEGGKHAVAYATAAEVNLTLGAFTWANASIYAPKFEDSAKGEYPEYSFPIRHGRSYTKLKHDVVVYSEPGYAFNDVVASGLAFELKDLAVSEEKDEEFYVTPNLYLYPAKGASITLYFGPGFSSADDAPVLFAGGMETIFKF